LLLFLTFIIHNSIWKNKTFNYWVAMTKAIKGFLVALLLCPQVGAEYKNSKKKDLIIEQVIYGKSFLGENLLGYKIYQHSDALLRKAAVITGGVHGNEFMGVVDTFPKMLTSPKGKEKFQSFFQAGGILIVVPQVNPDGIKRNNRYTVLGKDLNRDFDF